MAGRAENGVRGIMSQQLLVAFIVFAAVMCFTPGPNNVMLLASGLNYGFRRTLPHVAGVTFGFAFMIAVCGLGLGAVFTSWPVLQVILKYAGAAYLVYLAFAIGTAGAPDPAQVRRGRPMTFIGAALFQWVNVKGWVMVIGTITAYAAIATYPWNIVIQSLLSLAMGLLSTVTWALCGTALQPLLTSPRAIRAFNIVMALLLLASLVPVFSEP
jgi:threonine/homoserine/homoserine lactone efflux protein